MENQTPFKIKPWMLIGFILALLLLVFDFDPIGSGLDHAFGKGAATWGVSIILVVLSVYAFIKWRR